MLVIRQAQYAALGVDFWKRFQRSTVELFADRFPELVACGFEAFEQRVHGAMQRAREYGFDKRDHIRLFVELDLLRGAAWEQSPEARRALDILAEPDIDPVAKLHRVLKWVKKLDGYAG